MPSIAIASDSFCGGEEIADKVAKELSYRLVGIDEVFAAAAERYRLPQPKLVRALLQPHIAISTATRRRCAAYLEALITEHLLADEVVFCGPPMICWIDGVSHVIKVRISGDLDRRAQRLAQALGRTAKQAQKTLRGEEQQRRWWATLYRIDESRADLFDLVIDTGAYTVDSAVATMAELGRQRRFSPTTYSRKCMENFELAARVRATLVAGDPRVQVRAKDGVVEVVTISARRNNKRAIEGLKAKVLALTGVKKVEVKTVVDPIDRMAVLR